MAELETFFYLTTLTTNTLAANRATSFFPILVAQGFSIAVAIAKDSYHLVHAQQPVHQRLCPLLLDPPRRPLHPAPPAERPRPQAAPSASQNIALSNRVLENKQLRDVTGGLYSWLPDYPSHYKSRHTAPLLQRNGLSILTRLCRHRDSYARARLRTA